MTGENAYESPVIFLSSRRTFQGENFPVNIEIKWIGYVENPDGCSWPFEVTLSSFNFQYMLDNMSSS